MNFWCCPQGVDDKANMARKIPNASVNYHRNKISSNTYLETKPRAEPPKPLDITQPEARFTFSLPSRYAFLSISAYMLPCALWVTSLLLQVQRPPQSTAPRAGVRQNR